jgi:hypothetical protein
MMVGKLAGFCKMKLDKLMLLVGKFAGFHKMMSLID